MSYNFAKDEILRLQNGSKLYGLARSESDDDYVGIFVEPPEFVFSTNYKKTYNIHDRAPEEKNITGEIDGIAYSVRHFFKLATNGNPSILSLLFAPESAIVIDSTLGRSILSHKDLFISAQAGPRFKGYLLNQLQRLKGERGGHIPNRPELVNKHGYDVKYASQVARLAYQGIEYMTTGKITLPMPPQERTICREIRSGTYEYQECLDKLEALNDTLCAAVDETRLPSEPKYAKINQLSRTIHETHWKGHD